MFRQHGIDKEIQKGVCKSMSNTRCPGNPKANSDALCCMTILAECHFCVTLCNDGFEVSVFITFEGLWPVCMYLCLTVGGLYVPAFAWVPDGSCLPSILHGE